MYFEFNFYLTIKKKKERKPVITPSEENSDEKRLASLAMV
jgi:hypothetical protein